jgi:hypothetical protein
MLVTSLPISSLDCWPLECLRTWMELQVRGLCRHVILGWAIENLLTLLRPESMDVVRFARGYSHYPFADQQPFLTI